MAIGEHIRDLRWDAHLKQVELARRAGIAQNTLSQIELGRTVPAVPTLEKIAHGLGVDLSELVREPAFPLDSAPGRGPEELEALLEQVGSKTQNLADPNLVRSLEGASDAAVSRTVRETRAELALLIPELRRLRDRTKPGDDNYMALNIMLGRVSGQLIAFNFFLRSRAEVAVEEEALNLRVLSRELLEMAS